MKTRPCFNLLKRYLLALLLITQVFQTAGQSWDFGNRHTMLCAALPSSPLQMKMSGFSHSFLGKVGGVSFNTIAQPLDEQIGGKVNVWYDPSLPDGNRLVISCDDKTVNAEIYDWQLLPIINFSNSKHSAAVSLFGPRTTFEFYHIVYHPAFNNTLLGARLLQADIQLTDLNTFWRTPAYNNTIALGKGEQECVKTQEVSEASEILNSIMQQDGFQSWVLTDFKTNVRFSIDQTITFSGKPYYYVWTSDIVSYDEKKQELIQAADNYKKEAVKFESTHDLTSPVNAKKYEDLVKKHNSVIDRIEKLEPDTREVKSISSDLRENFFLFEIYNPQVYHAIMNTMNYSAFFRYVKKTNPESWSSLVESIRNIKPKPAVKTPVKYPKYRD